MRRLCQLDNTRIRAFLKSLDRTRILFVIECNMKSWAAKLVLLIAASRILAVEGMSRSDSPTRTGRADRTAAERNAVKAQP